MDRFEYKDGELHCEGVRAADIAEHCGTPAYVYSKATMLHHYGQIEDAFSPVSPLICYSVKANSCLAVIQILGEAGAGFDIVSGGELYKVLRAGQSADKIVFAGVGKTRAEMEYALKKDVFIFNVESEPELKQLADVAAAAEKVARVSLRINPDVDPRTHAYTTTGSEANKFGIAIDKAPEYARAVEKCEHLEFMGFHVHIGSQLTEVEPYAEGVEKILHLIERCTSEGIKVKCVNLGGGFGIFYVGDEAKSAHDFAAPVVPLLEKSGLKVIMEPGRFIVGNAGILLTRVVYVKHSKTKTFVICDAAMNDLIRPALYGGHHRIWPVAPKDEEKKIKVDVVGPICESGDFFARDREIPAVEQGDLLAIFSGGAYAMVMSSNFNSRPRVCEVIVDGESFEVVRRRETYEDLVATEVT